MTINFHPKKVINTEEYKQQVCEPKIHSRTSSVDNNKVEYEKLLEMYREELDNLEKQKQ